MVDTAYAAISCALISPAFVALVISPLIEEGDHGDVVQLRVAHIRHHGGVELLLLYSVHGWGQSRPLVIATFGRRLNVSEAIPSHTLGSAVGRIDRIDQRWMDRNDRVDVLGGVSRYYFAGLDLVVPMSYHEDLKATELACFSVLVRWHSDIFDRV